MFKPISLQVKLTIVFFITAVLPSVVFFAYYSLYTPDNITVVLLVIGVSVIFVTLTGFWVASRLTQSIKKIKDGTQRFANGDLTKRLSVSSNDEVGELAKNFNLMSDRLQESYQRLAIEKRRDDIILQSMGEGLVAVDEKAQIVLLNGVATALLDLPSADDVIGKKLYPFLPLHPDNKKDSKTVLHADKTPIHTTLKTGQPVSDAFGFTKSVGGQITLSVSTNPIIVDDHTVGAIMVLRDVTREKEVDRMKTEFISLASHQLRTPLSAIKWFSEMLLSGDAGKLKGDQLEFTENIAESTERMIQLVNSLLNISRIESGRIVIDPKPTDLKELVSGIVNDLKAKTEEKAQTLIISVHNDLPKIKLDPRLIGQVYLNLLTNAIKYTPKGGEISVFISKKDGNVISQVTDNGYGIPKEQQGRLFQKFFRASNAVKVETDGTGLGLYLIKAIIESSGGKIWYESEEGKGSTFWFSIPLSGMVPKEGEVTLDV